MKLVNRDHVIYFCISVRRVVHDDAIRIVKYSLEEMLSQDAADRALDFWLSVVEPFLGLPTRQREPSTKVSKRD